MNIMKWDGDIAPVMNLLLLADPEEAVVASYAKNCDLFVAVENARPVGVCALLVLDKERCELKNLAVSPHLQKQGIGRALVQYAVENARKMGLHKILLGTADVPGFHIAFYKSCGFKQTGVIRNFFIDNYSKPIMDNGNQCIDMIILAQDL